MSHQKNYKIESPLKGKIHSMLLENHQPTMYSSRITQKRKPIFDDTPCKSQASRSNSVRRKIFSKTQKSKQKEQDLHFSKLIQVQRFYKRQEQDLEEHQISQDDTIQSSSIQQDSGLGDVKRQLFPVTPIKKITYQAQQLQHGRQWLTNSSKNYKQRLFQDVISPPKSNISISTNNIEKTILKFNYNTPQNKEKLNKKQDSYQNKTQLNTQGRQSFIKNLYMDLSNKKNISQKQPQKNLAKQLRDLHSKILQKTKVYSKVDEQNDNLKQQNQRLRQQNQKLKLQKLRNSLKKQNTQSEDMKSQSQLRKIANNNLYVKVKVQKAKSILQNLLELSKFESPRNNSIINVQQTLKQVLKQLQF